MMKLSRNNRLLLFNFYFQPMNTIRFLLLNDSKPTDDDIKFVNRYLRNEKYFNSTLYFILLLIFGASSFFWLFGFGYSGTDILVSTLDLNVKPKTEKLIKIILYWAIPMLWVIIGGFFQRVLEKRKQSLIKLSEELSKKFKYNFLK